MKMKMIKIENTCQMFSSDKSYLEMKSKTVEIAKEVKRNNGW